MKVISILICHKLMFVVNIPDKSVTLNYILADVFCKLGDIYVFAQIKKNCN